MEKDGAWHDAQYNPRQSVADATRWLRGWADLSAQARSEVRVLADLAYGEGSNETADVFPSRRPGSPVLLFIHGGYWRALDKSDHSFIAPAFVDAGACVVIPNYSLCPAVSIADIVLQMVKAAAWTWRNAADWGGDRTRLVVAGHSAGGHLAAMLRCCEWPRWESDLPADLVRHAVSLSGLHDLAPLMRAPFLQPTIRLDSDLVARASPARLKPRGAGGISCLVGAEESAEFHWQNRLLQDHWGVGRVPVCESVEGTHHFSVLHALSEPGRLAFRRTCDALGLKS